MILSEKHIAWEVSIERDDAFYTSHKLCNGSYARINGEWRHNTGGSILEWHSCHTHICKCGCGHSKGELLEIGFQKTQRTPKIDKLLNDNE